MLTPPVDARLYRHRAPRPGPQGLGELGALVAAGKLKYRETVAPGLAAAPEAFIGLLKGRNFGKQLVKLI
jgi:NADPH-dependent curcumin reductase CurA